jgi:hypothetical protein
VQDRVVIELLLWRKLFETLHFHAVGHKFFFFFCGRPVKNTNGRCLGAKSETWLQNRKIIKLKNLKYNMNIIKTLAIAILMAISATMFAQTTDDDNGNGIGESTKGTNVHFTVYVPNVNTCGEFIDKMVLRIKWYWNNQNFYTPLPITLFWEGGNYYTGETGILMQAHEIEYCIEAFNTYHHGEPGRLHCTTSKREDVINQGTTYFIIPSNGWTKTCFGGYPYIQDCSD